MSFYLLPSSWQFMLSYLDMNPDGANLRVFSSLEIEELGCESGLIGSEYNFQ